MRPASEMIQRSKAWSTLRTGSTSEKGTSSPHIGQRCLIATSACVCGSAEIGNDVWIGPNATVSSEVKIGDRARITIGAVAVSDVDADMTVTGNFAVPHDLFLAHHLHKLRGE